MRASRANRRDADFLKQRRAIRGFLVTAHQTVQPRLRVRIRAVVDQLRRTGLLNDGLQPVGEMFLAEMRLDGFRRAE